MSDRAPPLLAIGYLLDEKSLITLITPDKGEVQFSVPEEGRILFLALIGF
jgi:hypothetical protein